MDAPHDDWEKLHPELQQVFNKVGPPKLPAPTLKNFRALRKGYRGVVDRYNNSRLSRTFLPAGPSNRTWKETDVSIPVRDGSNIPLRIYTPDNVSRDGFPVAIVCHGGGWFMGDLETENLLCQILCATRTLVVVNIGFRLYPDVSFGVPVLDVYDAVKWTAANIATYSGNPHRGFYAGGNSGGSTYAAIATFLARDEGLHPPITGNFLSCPILTDEWMGEDGELCCRFGARNRSFESNRNAPLMDRAMQRGIGALAEFDFRSPLLTTFNHANFANLPPSYIQVCGLDPWRDCGVIHAEELKKRRNLVDLKVYPGLPHCWWTTYPGLKVSEQWLNDLLGGIDWLMSMRGKKGDAAKL